jgi:HK97 family phage major capsid protein
MTMKKLKGYAGAKAGFKNRLKYIALAVLGVTLALCAFLAPEFAFGPEAFLAVAPLGLIVAKAKEQGVELSEGEQKMMGVIEGAFEQYASGKISKKELDELLVTVKEEIKKGVGDKLSELENTLKAISEEVKKMTDNGITLGEGSMLEKAVDAILAHPKVEAFINGKARQTGKISLKDIITSITNDYQGNILISQQSNRVTSEVAERRVNMRDIMLVDTGDPAFPAITYAQIYELNRNAATRSENGRLPESSFKIREITDQVSRIGTYLHLSKRLLKSRVYVRSYLINRLPKWIRMAEDFQILFGDGNGDNLNGIAKRSIDIAKWLTDNVVTGAAGDVASVESYDGGAKTQITFSKPFSKIEEGQIITFANAPGGSVLLTPNMLHKANDNVIMLDVAFAALTAPQIAALTFTVKNNFYNTVEYPNTGDAIEAIFSVLTYGEYTPNMIALNPSTVFEISTLKDTTGKNLNLVTTDANGVKRIGVRPIVETTAIDPGYYFCGDMINGASLVDYTALNIEFAEDVETRLANSVVLIADEEVILQVFNPFACAYGKLADVLAAITKV